MLWVQNRTKVSLEVQSGTTGQDQPRRHRPITTEQITGARIRHILASSPAQRKKLHYLFAAIWLSKVVLNVLQKY